MRSNHGFSYEDSRIIAAKCIDDFERCSICGLLQWFNRCVLGMTLNYPRGKERVNRRLTPDHIDPWGGNSLDNIRIVCFGCNDLRGAKIRSDEEIIQIMNEWYDDRFSQRHLWWLNRPRNPGRRFRNKWMKRKAEKLTGREFEDE